MWLILANELWEDLYDNSKLEDLTTNETHQSTYSFPMLQCCQCPLFCQPGARSKHSVEESSQPTQGGQAVRTRNQPLWLSDTEILGVFVTIALLIHSDWLLLGFQLPKCSRNKWNMQGQPCHWFIFLAVTKQAAWPLSSAEGERMWFCPLPMHLGRCGVVNTWGVRIPHRCL